MSEIVGDTKTAIDFLRRWYGGEPATIIAISPTKIGSIETIAFDLTTQHDRAFAWIDSRQGTWNMYFSVNPLKTPGKKTKKEDIRGVLWMHVDIDAQKDETVADAKERALKALQTAHRQASVVVDSGNGIQAFWRLDAEFPLEGPDDIAEAEARNRKIAVDYIADTNCFNIDRVMRLPGTINIPNETKKKKGRVPILATLLEFNDGAYSIDAFSMMQVDKVKAAEVIDLKAIPATVDVDAMAEMTEELRYVIRYGEHPTAQNRWGTRSDVVFWGVIKALQCGIKREIIASILLDKRFKISESIVEKKNSKDYAMRQIRRAEEKGGFAEKTHIEVKADNMEYVLNQAEAALANAGIDIFQQHGRLVRMIQRDENESMLIGDVKAHWLLEKFIAVGKWMKRSGKDVKPYEPKLDVAKHYLDREGEWRVPHLTGLVTTPTLRRDFTLLNEAGYDVDSGLFYNPGNVKYPPISPNPSRRDAVEALNLLIEPLKCFPFVPDDVTDDWTPDRFEGLKPSASRSVVFSAFITGVIRPTLPTAPMHIIDATEKGSGKGKIVDCISLVLTGQLATPMSMGNDETEDRKRLYSTLATGPRLVSIDNIERGIEGDALCTVLTQETWQERVLGKSAMGVVSTNTLFMATGNNASVKGDMTRRVLFCRLDARVANPDAREFDFDPRDICRSNRPEMVAACLTILLAYIAAGRPLQGKIKPMGSFEVWGIVREALVWLGQPDPVETRISVQSEDPARAAVGEMLTAWWDVYKDTEVKLSSVYSLIAEFGVDGDVAILRDIGTSVCAGGRLTKKGLTNWFQKNGNKIVEGRRFGRRMDAKYGMLVKILIGKEAEAIVAEEEIQF